ncbi:glutaminyl-peptide cyclotransferase [Sphingomonas oligoaromativorans]|uniref:glutaminyl-peptide cyclotransferase n=1 Tax=Sphingomonas oligoaromativorans TaxID=575322 RepID=UPI001421AB6E|nr:glutaminyl-peptide cyclotransferase [Sphingomonas oligoaromativorans]NIJ34613.1 glutamine cyclotransferase [Sphingomonas oligoaromativorans]
MRRIGRLAALLLTLAPFAARAALPVEQAEVVRTYPHDTHAFTEGLLFRDGYLYESTGREGQSFIRKVDLATGRTVESVSLAPGIFGEGIVDWKDQLYSVIWHGGIGSRWTLKGFRHLGTFRYSGEGWAMTQDGRNVILSDGTPVLRFLDPRTLQVVRTLTVTAEGVPIRQVNELEYVRGEILANIWMTNAIARIDPTTGHVKGWIDVSALAAKVGATDPDSVPNGIAYDKVGNRLFVTGKNWPLLFQIRLPAAR